MLEAWELEIADSFKSWRPGSTVRAHTARLFKIWMLGSLKLLRISGFGVDSLKRWRPGSTACAHTTRLFMVWRRGNANLLTASGAGCREV